MKRALTIIELIFTVVIIALVFTVIPRIIYVSNKSIETSATEEAIFNMMAKMSDIVFKEWDENNTDTDEILVVNQTPQSVIDCDKDTGYRIGGFEGSRNCQDDINISHIGADSNEPPYDDIDDYNGSEENTTTSGRKKKYFTLEEFASYIKEWNVSEYDYNNQSFDFKFNDNEKDKSNLKRVEVVVSQKVNGKDKNISDIKYYGANIGHSIIESESW